MHCPKCHQENPSGVIFCGRCGTALTKTKRPQQAPFPGQDSDPNTKTLEMPMGDLETGAIFAGRYQVIEKLGEGGMGKVYKVLDLEIDTPVALKLIHPVIATDRRTIERFRNELKLARGVFHKNINRMFDLNKEGGRYFITMEYVAGQDLGSMILMTGRLNVGTAMDIVKQVCRGLAEAHRLGIVHRDIKPSNIMIDKSGEVKIMDFGLARSVESQTKTSPGAMVGTPGYMSPEQAEGKETDPRSDIYSLGVVLFEMLTGRLPFVGDSALSTALKHKTESPPDPRELNAEIQIELSRAILHCLEKDREKRFRSADELRLELERIGSRITAAESGSWGRRLAVSGKIKRIFKDRRAQIAALFVLVIVAAIGLRSIKRGSPVHPGKKPMLVVLPFVNLGPAEDEYFADGMTEEITSRLSSLHGLGVISRTSSMLYKKTEKTLREIGEELGADYVLEGTVRWDRRPEGRGRVRITPQLIRVSDDTHLWSERYDRVIQDLFSVQSEIAEEVAKKLDILVLEPERRALSARPTGNLQAYDSYLRALEHYNLAYLHQDAREYERAIELLDRAVELDESFIAAYILESYVHSLAYDVGVDQTPERLAKSREAIDKALALQPDLPEAQLALATYFVRAFQDYDRALAIYESVQKARPNVPPSSLARIQMRQGKWRQAIDNYEQSFKLNPRSSQFAHMLGRLYAWTGRYEVSEQWFDRALSIYPELYYSELGKARLPLLARGDTKEARVRLEKLAPHRLTEYNLFVLGILERKYDEVLNLLASSSYDSFSEANFYIPADLAFASVYHAKKDFSSMRERADAARIFLEKSAEENPGDARFHASLGIAYAYLGRREAALREGRLAMSLYPLSRDAFEGTRTILNMAVIDTIVGEYEEAVEQLTVLLSVPSGNVISVPLLKIDPQWDPLRDHPGFERLLERKAGFSFR
jgi:serine/threonine protein kinase/tetratricopeptide (TPR) repeat protein